MIDEQKKEEGQNFSENLENNEEMEKKTIDEWNSEEGKDKKIKNLISITIVLAGLFAGSLFVDVSQFVSKGGYSERALRDAETFVLGDKTWVAYNEGIVEVSVLSPKEEDLKDCPDCDPTEVVKWLKQNLPTLVAKKVVSDSEEGKKMIEKYGLKTIPSFVFDKNVVDSEFYKNPQVQSIFSEKDGKYVMNAVALGVPVGKYLEKPTMEEGDSVMGNTESKTKVIVFSDIQCPYSKMFFETAMKVMNDYKDKVAFVHKDLPLSFHAQAKNAALAGRCAQEQNKFWEMAEVLYADQGNKNKTTSWDKQEGIKTFSDYATRIGLNIPEFNSCMESDKFADKISKDEELAGEFGISGTPSGFVGDEFVGGVIEEDECRKMLDEQIAKNQ